MRSLGKITAAAILILGFGWITGHAENLWRDRNLYSTGQSLKVGDILLVAINDISKMKFTMSVNSDNSFNFTTNPDTSLTSFLPKATASKSSTNKGGTKVSEQGDLKISIPATVTAELKYGKFKVEGARQYSFNGVVSLFNVSGTVDPVFVKGRQVESRDVADLRLSITGLREGAGVDIKRPALKENESASATLTEAEKQKIIVNYLNKIINELTQ